jgi:hypothetical protein
MPDVQIHEDPVHIDADDMAAVIEAIRDSGADAEATPQGLEFKAAWWILVLAWIGAEQTLAGFVAQLSAIDRRVSQHYRAAGKTPPRRIELFAPDGSVIASVEVEDDE